jgi:hypothetical protein
LTANGESYLLVPALGSEVTADELRADIVDAANPSRTVWSGDAVRRTSSGSFVILVPRDSLKPGTYRLMVYGVTGEREEPLNSYTFRVRAQ